MITPNAPHDPLIAPDQFKQRFLDFGYDEDTAGRLGMIENIDENFGDFVVQLAEWKMLENTLVIFMTDNGQARLGGTLNGKPVKLHNAGFKSGKGTAYEGGTHVPSFWFWKGVTNEAVDISALTAHIDLFKTFCELAGADIPDTVQPIDGRSLISLLQNPQADWADRKLFTHTGRWEQRSDPNLAKFKNCAVRTQRWRMVNNRELFDIRVDPKETVDVFANHPDVVAELRLAYEEWWTATVPLMVNENTPLATAQPQAIRYEQQRSERGIPKWDQAQQK